MWNSSFTTLRITFKLKREGCVEGQKENAIVTKVMVLYFQNNKILCGRFNIHFTADLFQTCKDNQEECADNGKKADCFAATIFIRVMTSFCCNMLCVGLIFW